MTLRVVTDSTADLPPQLCQELGIDVVPLRVYFGDEGFRDGVDLSAEEFYKRLTSSSTLPKTSQPSSAAFSEVYTALARETDQILSIHISSKLSQTLNSAQQAAKELEGKCRVVVVDSGQVSIGLGLVAIAAARAVIGGAGLDEAKQVAEKAAGATRTICLLDTLEYLAKGGRIGKLQFYLGTSLRHLSVFKVIPMLIIKDGEAYPLERFRTRQKGLERLAAEVLEADGIAYAGVVHSTTAHEAEELSQKVRGKVAEDSFFTSRFGPVLGTYVGPGAIGVTMTRV